MHGIQLCVDLGAQPRPRSDIMTHEMHKQTRYYSRVRRTLPHPNKVDSYSPMKSLFLPTPSKILNRISIVSSGATQLFSTSSVAVGGIPGFFESNFGRRNPSSSFKTKSVRFGFLSVMLVCTGGKGIFFGAERWRLSMCGFIVARASSLCVSEAVFVP